MKGLTRIALLVAAGALMVSGLVLAGEGSWFDMENCSICKNIMADPELIQHMTWNQYKISNGILSVTNVDKEYKKSFETCSAKMEAAGQKLAKGEKLPMCNSCTTLSALMMKGLKTEQIKTDTGGIWVLTSEDPAVVTEVQKWAERNKAEMAKMHAAEGAGS